MSAAGRRAAAALLLFASACAGVSGSGRGARAALDALVARSDAADARARASELVARSPRDPWARLAAALLARRALQPMEEAAQLVALAAGAPDHPLALVALRRLAELAEESPAVARAIEAGVAPPLAAGKLTGLAAYRARVARIAAAEVLGEHERAARLRSENGSVTAWTIAGPFGLRRALDFARPFPPDGGIVPASVPSPLGGAPRPTRTLPVPDGTVALEGEPGGADVFYLAADVTLARGGRYLLALGTSMSARVQLDGAAVYERRDFAAHLPTVVHLRVDLAAGVHRVLVKVARSGDRSGLHLAFAREDGSPSDAAAVPVPPGAPPAVPAPAPPRVAPGHDPRALAVALEREAGPGIARLVAGLDAAPVDREAAKALLAEAAEALPGSAAVRVARAAVLVTESRDRRAGGAEPRRGGAARGARPGRRSRRRAGGARGAVARRGPARRGRRGARGARGSEAR